MHIPVAFNSNRQPPIVYLNDKKRALKITIIPQADKIIACKHRIYKTNRCDVPKLFFIV